MTKNERTDEQPVSTRYRAIIVGEIWWPIGALASTEREYFVNDFRGYVTQADADAEAIEAASTTEAGDFSSVKAIRVARWTECQAGDNQHAYWAIIHDFTEDEELLYWDTLEGVTE